MSASTALSVYDDRTPSEIDFPECPDIYQGLERIDFFHRCWYRLIEKLGKDSREAKNRYLAERFEDNLTHFGRRFEQAFTDMQQAGEAYKDWVEYVEEKRRTTKQLRLERTELSAQLKQVSTEKVKIEQDLELIVSGNAEEAIKELAEEPEDGRQLYQAYQHSLATYSSAQEKIQSRREEIASQLRFYENTLLGDEAILTEIAPTVKAAARKFAYAKIVLNEAKRGGLAKAGLLKAIRNTRLLDQEALGLMQDMKALDREVLKETAALQERADSAAHLDQLDAENEVDLLLTAPAEKQEYLDVAEEVDQLLKNG